MWFFWTLPVLLQRWCSTCLTHWHRGKAEKEQSPEYSKIFRKNTIFHEHPVPPLIRQNNLCSPTSYSYSCSYTWVGYFVILKEHVFNWAQKWCYTHSVQKSLPDQLIGYSLYSQCGNKTLPRKKNEFCAHKNLVSEIDRHGKNVHNFSNKLYIFWHKPIF